MDCKNNILKNIEHIVYYCKKYIVRENDGLLYYHDPNDRIEISAHYGASHVAASFIIYGKTYNTDIYRIGIDLLKSILTRWKQSVALPAFHFDFNNFALCICEAYIDDPQIRTQIKEVVCKTPDSNHDTVNWIPMRWYVNEMRYTWTKNQIYRHKCAECKSTIIKATNSDGGIEDRLPWGKSFNLQYDISTLATLQLLKRLGIENNLSANLGFLISSVMPDGDINYQGRGCNQIFAWGPWIYLLSSSCQVKELENAITYLESDDKVKQMVKNNNMMLNCYPGAEKYLWWDYHYASVYIAHFLFWLILSYQDFEKFPINPIVTKTNHTGLHIIKSSDCFISWFSGRKEYLAEKGPIISGIWTKSLGTIFKGTFGPWQGLFGNKYIFEDIILKNYLGIIGIKKNRDFSNSRIMRKFDIKTSEYCSLIPIFSQIKVDLSENTAIITWLNKNEVEGIFNAPFCVRQLNCELQIDNIPRPLINVGQIHNQYGARHLFQSHLHKGIKWQLRITLN